MSADLPGISVVVIGRNEGDRLVRCLESVLASDYPADKIEVVYVDSDSTDDSCARAEGLGAKVVRLKPERPAAAIGRNVGLRSAEHELIQFFDGDTIVDKSWLRRAAQVMSDPQVACVFGRREESAPTASIYNFWTHHDWYVSPGIAESCAGDALFRRAVLERAGGYDESLIAGEEPDLCHRISRDQGMKIVCLDEPMTLHDIGMTRFGQYWRRCVRTGHAYAEVGGRHRGMRRWRAKRWRNLAHAVAAPLAVALSIGLRSMWPIAIWVLLVAVAVIRNALRLRRRVGSLRGALLCALHHFLSKTPMAIGQCTYWVRLWLGRSPQPLIEYRK